MMRLVATGLGISLASCARGQCGATPDRSSPAVSSVPAITLERTACFGGCPVYTLSITPGGQVQYDGKAHVRKVAGATGTVPPEQVDALLSELERGGYFTFADRYT